MAEQTLAVLISGRIAGELVQNRHGRLAFEYDDQWRSTRSATPLSLSMPLARRSHPHRVVHAYLRNLLPDSEPVLTRWARRFGVSPNNPFALLERVGEDVAGAAQFVPSDRVDQALSEGGLHPVDERYMAARLRTLQHDRSAWDDADSPGQFSLAGAQAKFAIRQLEDGTWAVPYGREATTHIVKPSLPDLDHQEANEHLCLRAASRLGLMAARSEVRRFGTAAAIVIERYDRRVLPTGQVQRIHQEDGCQALGIEPDRKYERGDGGPSALDVIRLIRATHRPHDAELDAVERFFRALAFNWVVRGPDAHAKNYSFLLQGSAVRLAPLYDVTSVAAYPDRYPERGVAMAMAINGKWENRLVTGADWIAFASSAGVDGESALAWVGQVVDDAPQAVADAIADEPAWVRRLSMTGRLLDGVAAAAKSCSLNLGHRRTDPRRFS